MRIKEPDYLEFWRELVSIHHEQSHGESPFFSQREKAEAYEAGTRRKNRERPDALVEFVKDNLKTGETVLDIGAGTGRWTVPLATAAAKVTAVEPAGAMMDILRQNADEAGVTDKIDFVQSTWQAAEIGIYDVVTCAHAIYMVPDFAGFVRKMEAHARRRCYLGIRHFPIDGIIPELCAKIYGYRHDSPNFIIAYNALYQMGIYGNVLMEELQHRWTDATLNSAFDRAKRHLRLEGTSEYDDLVRSSLERRLALKDSIYSWPDGMNSALIWWDINPNHHRERC